MRKTESDIIQKCMDDLLVLRLYHKGEISLIDEKLTKMNKANLGYSVDLKKEDADFDKRNPK